MLSLFSCSPGICINPFSGWYGNGTGTSGVQLTPLLGPFDASGNFTGKLLDSIDGRIFTGSGDLGGDKACSHQQIAGDLILPSFDVTTISTPGYLIPVYSSKVAAGNVIYSHLAHDGTDDLRTRQIRSTDGKTNGTWIDVVRVEGRNVVIGYARTVTNPYRTDTDSYCVKYTFSEDWKKYCSKVVLDGSAKTKFSQYRDFITKVTPSTVGIPSKACMIFDFIPKTQQLPLEELHRNLVTCFDQNIFDAMTDLRSKFTWGDLCQLSIDSVNYCSVNVISFIRELRDWRKLIPKIGKLLSPKTYASVYLWYKYGLTLSIQDSQALVKAVRNSFDDSLRCNDPGKKFAYASQFTVSRVRKYEVRSTYRYKIAYEAYPAAVMNVIRELKRWGIYPTLENAWDMIPFSFVADWFTNLNEVLHEMDTHIFSEYYNVLWVCRSQKHIRCVPGKEYFPGFAVVGEISQTNYQRTVKKTLDLPRVRLDLPSEFHNYAEFTALIVQLHK